MNRHIQSLHVLRGLSALMVMVYHHGQFFWLNQTFCSRLCNSFPINDHPNVSLFLEALPINLGNLGVAIFFLISGFLMAYIAPGKTRQKFLKMRLIRIWPAYAGSLFFVLFLVGLISVIQGHITPWNTEQIFASFFLMRDLFGYPFIDGIVWTLEIEIKFYLLCTLLLPYLQNKPSAFFKIIFFTALLSGILWLGRERLGYSLEVRYVWLFIKSMKFITFMSLGSLICFVYQKNIALAQAIKWGVGLGGLYLVLLHLMNLNPLDLERTIKEGTSYGIAFFLFLLALWKKRIELFKTFTQWLGTRSYSLYLIHGVPGFVLMYALLKAGIEPTKIILFTLITSILSASVFFELVEKKLMTFMSRLHPVKDKKVKVT